VYSKAFNNMCVKLTATAARDDMEIIITGDRAHELFTLSIDWALTEPLERYTVPASRLQLGSLAIATDSDVRGRVYSRDIFIDCDAGVCEALHLALNITTQLGRDRHKLPDQTGLLKHIFDILDKLLEPCEKHSSAPTGLVGKLFQHLMERFRAGVDDPAIKRAAQESALKPVMRHYHALVHCPRAPRQDNIVFAAGSALEPSATRMLQQLGKYVVYAGALADSLDVRSLTLKCVEQSPKYKPTSAEQPYLAALQQLVKGLELNTRFSQALMQLEVKDVAVTEFCCVDVRSARRCYPVYLSKDLLQGDAWTVAAICIQVRESAIDTKTLLLLYCSLIVARAATAALLILP
jgi:hypothetical protein